MTQLIINKYSTNVCGKCSQLIDIESFHGEHYGFCKVGKIVRSVKEHCTLDITGKDISLDLCDVNRIKYHKKGCDKSAKGKSRQRV